MAEVRIADVIVPTPFSRYIQRAIIEKNAFIQSGVIVGNPLLRNGLLAVGGDVLTMPAWDRLDTSVEENSGNDDPLDIAIPNKIGSDTERTPRINRNQSWSEMNLARILAGSRPLDAIQNHVANYFLTRRQIHLIALSNVMVADSQLNHADDLIIDIYTNGVITDANRLNEVSVNAAVHTSGDSFDVYTTIAIHSRVHQALVDNDQIDFIPPSQGAPAVPFFLGLRVIVDDTMPVVDPGGGDPLTYTSFVFGGGVFAMEDVAPSVPTELDRESQTGKGQGQDILIQRTQYALHMNGYKWLGDTLGPALSNPTNAENATVGAWLRSGNVDRKDLKFAAIIHNV